MWRALSVLALADAAWTLADPCGRIRCGAGDVCVADAAGTRCEAVATHTGHLLAAAPPGTTGTSSDGAPSSVAVAMCGASWRNGTCAGAAEARCGDGWTCPSFTTTDPAAIVSEHCACAQGPAPNGELRCSATQDPLARRCIPRAYGCDINKRGTWTAEEAAWCCTRRQIGCTEYSCRPTGLEGPEAWSTDRRAYCCMHTNGLHGCPEADMVKDPAVYDCYSGEQWTLPKRVWCCSARSIMCPAPLHDCWGTAPLSAAAEEYCCATHRLKCTPRTLPRAACGPQGVLPAGAALADACCTAHGMHCGRNAKPAFACDAVAADAIAQWAEPQRAYCCARTGRGCREDAPPYNCDPIVPVPPPDAGVVSVASEQRRAWCCATRGTGCLAEGACLARRHKLSPRERLACCADHDVGCAYVCAPYADAARRDIDGIAAPAPRPEDAAEATTRGFCCQLKGVGCPAADLRTAASQQLAARRLGDTPSLDLNITFYQPWEDALANPRALVRKTLATITRRLARNETIASKLYVTHVALFPAGINFTSSSAAASDAALAEWSTPLSWGVDPVSEADHGDVAAVRARLSAFNTDVYHRMDEVRGGTVRLACTVEAGSTWEVRETVLEILRLAGKGALREYSAGTSLAVVLAPPGVVTSAPLDDLVAAAEESSGGATSASIIGALLGGICISLVCVVCVKRIRPVIRRWRHRVSEDELGRAAWDRRRSSQPLSTLALFQSSVGITGGSATATGTGTATINTGSTPVAPASGASGSSDTTSTDDATASPSASALKKKPSYVRLTRLSDPAVPVWRCGSVDELPPQPRRTAQGRSGSDPDVPTFTISRSASSQSARPLPLAPPSIQPPRETLPRTRTTANVRHSPPSPFVDATGDMRRIPSQGSIGGRADTASPLEYTIVLGNSTSPRRRARAAHGAARGARTGSARGVGTPVAATAGGGGSSSTSLTAVFAPPPGRLGSAGASQSFPLEAAAHTPAGEVSAVPQYIRTPNAGGGSALTSGGSFRNARAMRSSGSMSPNHSGGRAMRRTVSAIAPRRQASSRKLSPTRQPSLDSAAGAESGVVVTIADVDGGELEATMTKRSPSPPGIRSTTSIIVPRAASRGPGSGGSRRGGPPTPAQGGPSSASSPLSRSRSAVPSSVTLRLD